MNIFQKIDNFNHNFLGFNPLGAFQNVSVWRKYILILLIISTSSWIVFGWESTWNQPFTYLKNIPALITGQTSLTTVQFEASQYYGLGQHLSSAVIYGVAFLLLSIHLEKLNIKKSMNFMFTTTLSLMSVGIYEIVYNLLYSNLQNQPWTFSFVWKQGLNLSMFTFFIVIGTISIIYLYSINLRPNFNKTTKFLLLGSILTYCLWIFFPLPVTSITIGEWTSTQFFPQTMYAVGPVDGVAMGNPYFIENNLLHLVNVLNKVFMALTVLSFVMVRRKQK